MVFVQSFRAYADNLTTALAFALLLVFVFPFFWLSNTIVSSGTVLIDYGFLRQNPFYLLVLLALALLFLFSYSLLVSLMVFAVRSDLGPVKLHYYLREKMGKFAFKYFVFLAVVTIISAVIASLLIDFGVSAAIINLVLLLVSVSFLFLPQTIVIDEESLFSSMLTSLEFIVKNPGSFFLVLVFGIVGIVALQIVEFVLDYFFVLGNFVTLLFVLVVLVPFLEALKTYVYMNRFGIIQSYHKS